MADVATVNTQSMPVDYSYTLLISNKKDAEYLVDPLEGVKLIRNVDCIPSRLEFSVVNDGILQVVEGDIVRFSVGDTVAFQGYIFEIQRNKNDTKKITCYDQLRYWKNKDCIVYYDKTATELIESLCNDYSLTIDKERFANTQYKIDKRVEDNKTIADIVMYALDITLINTPNHTLYYCFDDGGKIVLLPNEKMMLDTYIDAECIEDFTHTSSIDKDTYTAVKVVRQAQGEIGQALVQTGYLIDKEHAKQWGVLQYLLRPDDKDGNAIEKAKRIMQLKNRITHNIPIKKAIGDIRVRGGSIIYVNLDFGDLAIKDYIQVQSVEHHFINGYHYMDLMLNYIGEPAPYEVTLDKDKEVFAQIQQAKNETSKGNGAAITQAMTNNEGRVSPYTSNGCVETVTAVGGEYNAELATLHREGVTNVEDLCNRLESNGHKVETFNGYANKGDLLVYGNRDHVVIADGVGGCFGNSTAKGCATSYNDLHYAFNNGDAPTEIIRMS